MGAFAAYSHAAASVALLGLMLALMGPVVGMKKAAAGLAPGADPVADYNSVLYRWHRAYANLGESLAAFVAVTVAAVLAGASPLWVNLLASLFLLARITMAVVHVRGIGSADRSLRSIAFGIGLVCCVVLGLLAVTAAVGGHG